VQPASPTDPAMSDFLDRLNKALSRHRALALDDGLDVSVGRRIAVWAVRRPARQVAGLLLATLVTGCGEDSSTTPGPLPADPPFGGTIFIDPDIITSSDPTTYTGLVAIPARCSTGA
jgi:hypothetical protein